MMNRLFALFTLALLIAFGIALWRDNNREWKKHQADFVKKEYNRAKAEYEEARTQFEEAGDRERKEQLRKDMDRIKLKMEGLKNTKPEIKQILLQGGKVDRCSTCHLDTDKIARSHANLDDLPVDRRKCSVCHGGDGQATTAHRAHETLRKADDVLKDYIAISSAQMEIHELDYREYLVSGRKLKYVGSEKCLKCHLARNRRHVERWTQSKFTTFARIEEGLQKFDLMEVKPVEKKPDREECFFCHTTGYDPIAKTYAEPGVTCEGCHGPGEVFFGLMSGGYAAEGAKIARANVFQHMVADICGKCHNPQRHDLLYGKDIMKGILSVQLPKDAEIVIDGKGDELFWKEVIEYEIETTEGPKVTIKSVYDHEKVYFLVSWPDTTLHNAPLSWVYTGSEWELRQENQDGLAFFWSINDSVADFNLSGCGVLCHDSGKFAKSKRMFANSPTEFADRWLWRPVYSDTHGRLNDGYLDRTIKRDRGGAHKSDGDGMGLAENVTERNGQEVPKFMPGEKGAFRGALPGEVSVEIDWDTTEFEPNTRLPGFVIVTNVGKDSADIETQGVWDTGQWTLEFARKLETGSDKDIQFDNLAQTYHFGLAVFNDAEGEDREKHNRADLIPFEFLL